MSRRTRDAAGVAILLTAMAMAGCHSYQPRPLDLKRYAQDWRSRSISDDSVVAFADELATQEGTPLSAFDPNDGLTLAEAEAVALLLNPRVRVLRLQADVPLVGAREAGRWNDPSVSFDVMRILSSVQEPWILGGGVSLTLPISGRLAVERDLAWADYTAAWREAALAEWRLLTDLQTAWFQWSAAQREVDLLRDHLDRLEPIEQMAADLVGAGELASTEARVLRMETARRRVQLEQRRAEAQQQRVALLALLGLPPEASVELVPAIALSELSSTPDQEAASLQRHPAVLLSEAEYEIAEQRLHREIRRQYPDLTLGPRSEWEQGQSRIGLGGSLPVPLWNRNTRRIKEARAAREAARAEAEATLQRLTHRLEQLRAEARAAQRRRQSLERQVAPLVDEQMEEVHRLIDLGEVNVLLLQDALTRALQVKRAVLEAGLEQATAEAALHAMLQPRWVIEQADDASKERK